MSHTHLPLALLALATLAFADDTSGMPTDPMAGMNMMGSTAPGQMLGYLHFAPLGDLLWFPGWVPTRAGPMAGACLGLFLLAVFDRWLAAARAVVERSWARACVPPAGLPSRLKPANRITERTWRSRTP
jgi:solute carrier family 31 (copper transporter), member 1